MNHESRITNHLPHDLTLDCRRLHRARARARDVAWLCVFGSIALLSVALGVLIAALNNYLLSFLAALALLAGINGARYLLTRH
jgi:hypothetical protein